MRKTPPRLKIMSCLFECLTKSRRGICFCLPATKVFAEIPEIFSRYLVLTP